ncbi:MAG: penicillin acylase family protein [Gammaproteobacteria bacterium]
MLSLVYKALTSSPILVRFALIVIVPLLFGGAYLWGSLADSLPVTNGELVVEAFGAPVIVTRDLRGVPSIDASSDRDAYMALGFVHAQDRMWQMELQRRTAQGRLSEVLGRDNIPSDIIFRTLDLYGSAQRALPTLGEEALVSLEAYAEGVNAWLSQARTLPIEFRTLGMRPEPWTVIDSLAWMKVFALNLSGNYQQELNRLVVKSMVSDAHYAILFPDADPNEPVTIVADAAGQTAALGALNGQLDDAFERLGLGGKYVGSNAWAVSATRTGNGRALLANDPHLGLQMPSVWYVASLTGDQLEVTGMTLPGLPTVIFGHNQHIAWGGTNLMADVQDLYVEQINPADQSTYRAGDEWLPFVERVENIEVKANFPAFLRPKLRPVKVRVRSTRHGPIISDLIGLDESPLALRWTALASDDNTYEAFYALGYAQDFTSFRSALNHVVAPALNFVYADQDGSIGYAVAGRIPIRPVGDGSMPVPGSTDEFEWSDFVPLGELPYSLNPPSDFVVSANNRPVGPSYPYFISRDWASPARARRIAQMIEEAFGSGPVSVESIGAMQMDTVDRSVQAILPHLIGYRPTSDEQREALAHLRDWDGDMAEDSPAATIVVGWLRSLKFVLMRDEFSGYWNTTDENRATRKIRRSVDTDVLTRILADDSAGWCDDISTETNESCADMLDMALTASIASTTKLLGTPDMDKWRWGDAHELKFKHMPFSQTKVLDSLFERRIANGGSPDSVNAANANFVDAVGYEQDFGASFRSVIEMGGERPNMYYVNSTGQSGNVISDHYDDMVRPFRDGRLFELEAEQTNDHVLTLTPY